MFRIGLFPHHRNLGKDGYPVAQALFIALARSFVESFQRDGLRLPTLEECLVKHRPATGQQVPHRWSEAAVSQIPEQNETPPISQTRWRRTAYDDIAV